MFSDTTIASSTISPVAKTKANKVRMLIEKPNNQITANAPMSDIGIATEGTMVARHEPINTHNVPTTNRIVKASDVNTSSTELRINFASSEVITISNSGYCTLKRSTNAIVLSEISILFERAWRIIPKPITDLPSSRVIPEASAGEKNTVATSPTRVVPRITIFSTSSTVTELASARTMKIGRASCRERVYIAVVS